MHRTETFSVLFSVGSRNIPRDERPSMDSRLNLSNSAVAQGSDRSMPLGLGRRMASFPLWVGCPLVLLGSLSSDNLALKRYGLNSCGGGTRVSGNRSARPTPSARGAVDPSPHTIFSPARDLCSVTELKIRGSKIGKGSCSLTRARRWFPNAIRPPLPQ